LVANRYRSICSRESDVSNGSTHQRHNLAITFSIAEADPQRFQSDVILNARI